jgi:hypothetical protein
MNLNVRKRAGAQAFGQAINAPRYKRRYKEGDEDSEYITPSTFKYPKIIPDSPVERISLTNPDYKNKFMNHILPTVAAFGLGSLASKALNFHKRHVLANLSPEQVFDNHRPKLTLEPASSIFVDNKEPWILPEWNKFLENYESREEEIKQRGFDKEWNW